MPDHDFDTEEIRARMTAMGEEFDNLIVGTADVSGSLTKLQETWAERRDVFSRVDGLLAGLTAIVDPKPRIMLLYATLTDPETGDETDNRVALYCSDWLIAESHGEGSNSPLARDDVEAMAYNLAQSLGVKNFSKHVTLVDDFELGSFEWDFALTALREQDSKQAAPKMGM